MLFLWKTTHKNKKTKSKIPSPKRNHDFLNLFIERALLPTALRSCVRAGMTVEAAVVLPLFLFFFLNLGSAMEMIRLHGNLQLALWNTGNQLCVYGHAAQQVRDGGNGAKDAADESSKAPEAASEATRRNLLDELGDIALTYSYVKGQVVSYVGDAYLQESPLHGGAGGLQFWESDIGADDIRADKIDTGGIDTPKDVVNLVLTYEVSPWSSIPAVRPFRMMNRYYGRMWTGYDLLQGETDGESADVVYVTDNRSVYHESKDCTHLLLSIHAVPLSEAKLARNQYGRRYTMCSKCRSQKQGNLVYICSEGDYYHYSIDCSGLKRTIHTITRRQALSEGLPPCSRCGNKVREE